MSGQRQDGFSLLELLVALFVVVIITSLVTLTVNSGGQDVELDARVRSIADISSYALDEAQMRGVDMGLFIERVDENEGTAYAYSWHERSPEGWRKPTVDADIFDGQRFPIGLELLLEVDDVLIDVLSAEELELEKLSDGLSESENGITAEILPQVIFYSSGEATVASIQLRHEQTGDLLWRIEWDLLGRNKLLRRGELSEDDTDESR